jgi:uncharacterized membrane protein YqjE
MAGLPSFVTELFGVAGRLGGAGLDMLGDRLELAALELREANIRFIQALILACAGTILCLFGLGLLILAAVFALPLEWRLLGIGVMAGLSLLGGLAAFLSLRRRISERPLTFAQSLAELEKDKTCF